MSLAKLIVLRFSAGGDAGRYDSIIGEVISAAPDIVVTANNPVVLRFKTLTKSTPIVALMGDPVAWGIVRSLAHPGGGTVPDMLDQRLDIRI